MGKGNCQIHVIGVDDSGPACLAASELALIDRAELLCGGRRHLDLFPSAPGERLMISGDLEALYVRLSDPAAGGAVVLASGDPCFFGIGPLLAERFGLERVIIHPHAGSIATAFARLGLAWQDATVLSVHGRPIEDAIHAALTARKLAILTDPEHTPAAVAAELLAAGMPDCPAYVFERVGGSAERVHELGLSELPGREFDRLNVLVMLPNGNAGGGVQDPALRHHVRLPRGFGRTDKEYVAIHGQITKAEVRAVTLSRLEPWDAMVLWDVGAGSGSVSIEAAGLMAGGTVYAVERDPEQIEALQRNIWSHGAANVCVVAGCAPAALDSLPDPDAVFIGGAGAALREVLAVCAPRLKTGGRLVCNFALLESLATWQAFAADLGWKHDLTQISVSRGEALGDGTRFAPLSPVFVARLTRPERET